jgi:hypothetical protein
MGISVDATNVRSACFKEAGFDIAWGEAHVCSLRGEA